MRRTASLLVLSALACNPKVDVDTLVTDTDAVDTDVTTLVDTDAVDTDAVVAVDRVVVEPPVAGLRWSDDAGRLDLGKTLGEAPVALSKDAGWTTRSSRGGGASGFGSGASGFGRASGGGGLVGGGSGYGGGRASADASEEMEIESGRGVGGAAPRPKAEDELALMAPTRDISATSVPPSRRPYPMPPPPPVAQQPLKAGTTDDNADLSSYLAFYDTWTRRGDLGGAYDALDVRDRLTVKVVDGAGRAVPGAKVSFIDPNRDALVWTASTYGDGKTPFYPHLSLAGYGGPGYGQSVPGGIIVQAMKGDTYATARWDGRSDDLVIRLDKAPAAGGVKLDVVFLIDTTGSMSDEIQRIKDTLLSVTDKLRGEAGQLDLRYGAVLYRDLGDEYVTQHYPFTKDLETFDAALQGIWADGGGDTPESLNQGLAVTIGDMDWRPNAAKVAFLVADAPPHMDYQQDVRYGRSVIAGVHKGIKVHTVAASGLDAMGSLVFRQIAQFTRGKFIFIEYGGSISATAASHGVGGQVGSNNLDAILYREIKAEIDGWAR